MKSKTTTFPAKFRVAVTCYANGCPISPHLSHVKNTNCASKTKLPEASDLPYEAVPKIKR